LGKTVFLTTHYMDEAEYLADRIIVLADGVIVAEGEPATLGGRDRSAARIEFTLPESIGADQLPAPFANLAANGRRIVRGTTTPMNDLHALSSWALEAGIELPDVEVRRPTLEDIYLELTGAPRSATSLLSHTRRSTRRWRSGRTLRAASSPCCCRSSSSSSSPPSSVGRRRPRAARR
jgi:ABC-2 type transport system ATP-binding protein